MTVYRVPITPALSEFVQQRIARFEDESAPNQQWLSQYVKRHNVLPLFCGWLETLGIDPSGYVCKFSADGDVAEYEGLRDPGGFAEFALALVEGARRYGELSALLPDRTI